MPPHGFLGSIAILSCGLAHHAAEAAPVAEMTAATIRDLGLQAALPTPEPPLSGSSWHLPDVVLWLVVAGAVTVLLYSLVGLRWRGQMDAITQAAVRDVAAGDPSDHLGRAEQFAQQGLFVQAMHELLLEGFRLIRARAEERVADSLTSREILRRALLPEQGVACLRDIIMRVEWTYFGAHAATRDDYQACRANFDTLRAVLHPAANA